MIGRTVRACNAQSAVRSGCESARCRLKPVAGSPTESFRAGVKLPAPARSWQQQNSKLHSAELRHAVVGGHGSGAAEAGPDHRADAVRAVCPRIKGTVQWAAFVCGAGSFGATGQAKRARVLDCGGKRSATPLWIMRTWRDSSRRCRRRQNGPNVGQASSLPGERASASRSVPSACTCLELRLRQREERGLYAASALDNSSGTAKFLQGVTAQTVKRPEGRAPTGMGVGR